MKKHVLTATPSAFLRWHKCISNCTTFTKPYFIQTNIQSLKTRSCRGLNRRRSRPQPRRGHNHKNFPGIAIPSVIKPSEEMYCFILRISELKKMMEHVNNKWFTFIWDYVKNGNSGEKYPGLSSNVE